MPDTSEQYFSASLDAPAERPRFVVDTSAEPVPTEAAVAAKAKGGTETNTSAVESVVPSAGAADISEDGASQESVSGISPSDWRNEVSAKVSRYRSRKPRTDRYPSLQLQFEASPLRDQTPREALADAPAETRSWTENPEAQSPREPVVMEATARVLEFPRPVLMPGRSEELAEPVMVRPRIVEAPELLPPPPALGGILIEPVVADETDRLPGLDVPLQSSPFSRRVLAGMIDAGMVGIALAVFGYIFLRINGGFPPVRVAAEVVAALLAVLWPVYQYAFLVHSTGSPGLWLAKLEVTRFDGAPASRSLRRWRVMASLLSCASLGLGYAWCFLDEDQLSWHDRITRTHLGLARSAQTQVQLQRRPQINAD